MLQIQEVLPIYKIEFLYESTTAILTWENVDLCFFRSKIYNDVQLRGEGVNIQTSGRRLEQSFRFVSDHLPLTVHLTGKMIKKDEFDSIIESLRGEIALREEDISLKNRIKTLEAQFESSDKIRNKIDQYSCRNNVAVDGIRSSVKKRELQDKCIDVLGKQTLKLMNLISRHVIALVNHPKKLSVSLTESFAQHY